MWKRSEPNSASSSSPGFFSRQKKSSSRKIIRLPFFVFSFLVPLHSFCSFGPSFTPYSLLLLLLLLLPHWLPLTPSAVFSPRPDSPLRSFRSGKRPDRPDTASSARRTDTSRFHPAPIAPTAANPPNLYHHSSRPTSRFSQHTNHSRVSFNSRSGRSMAGLMDSDRSRSRRDRTFVGSECAVCEEPLEHTLRGERVLQFSCGHVSHEACFYEFIREFEGQYCPTCNAPLGLDTSRGGNVLDIGKPLQTITCQPS